MSSEQRQLEAGIQALEAQRALLGDAVVAAFVAGMRAKLVALQAARSTEPAQTPGWRAPHAALQAHAARIADERPRQGLLAHIPEHREIVALGAKRGTRA